MKFVVKPVCDECGHALNHGPLWCAWCHPGRVLCAACMTKSSDGDLICIRCKKQWLPLLTDTEDEDDLAA